MTTYPDGTRSGSIALPQRLPEGLAATLAAHDARVSELLRANSAEVERRRAAEERVRELEAEVATLRRALPSVAFSPPGAALGSLVGSLFAQAMSPAPADLRRQALDACLAQDRADWDAAGRW